MIERNSKQLRHNHYATDSSYVLTWVDINKQPGCCCQAQIFHQNDPSMPRSVRSLFRQAKKCCTFYVTQK